MLSLIEILNSPLGIVMMMILGFILTGSFKFPLEILIIVYVLIAIFVFVFVNSDQGSKQLSKKRKRDEDADSERQKRRAEEEARQAEEALRQAEEEEAIRQQRAKIYEELVDIERTPLRNLQTNLATNAIEELAKVNARLNVSVILKDFPSVIAPAVFAVDQFESSSDYEVSDYLSSNIKVTCIIYQCLQECFSIKIEHTVKGWGAFTSIAGGSEVGKLIAKILPEQPRMLGSYDYDQTTQAMMAEASKYIVKLNEILQVIRKISPSTNSVNVSTTDPFEQIAKLKKLKDDGIITDSEFESKKKDLIDRM